MTDLYNVRLTPFLPPYTKKPELNRAFGNHKEGMADVVSTQCYDYFDAVRMKIESPILVNTSL